MEASRDRVDVSKVLNEAFSIYGSNAGLLLGAALAIFVIAGIVQGLLNAAGGIVLLLIGQIVYLIAVTLYSGMVVKLVEDLRDGRRDMTVGEMLSSVSSVLGALVGNSILKAIAVVIGFALLIVPGLILITIWAVTAPAIVTERASAIGAFGRSRELVRGDGWSVFAVLVVTLLIVIGVGLVLGLIGAATGDAGQVIFSMIASVITAPVFALVTAVVFFDLGGGVTAPTAATAPGEPPVPPTAPTV